jgi:hypothetical protein
MATFRDCWNLVSLHADTPDPLMCRAWTQWAYNRFCDRRGWSHLRAETAISVGDQKIGICTVVQGSATVTGSIAVDGMQFAATDVGRQFRLGTIPIYTIIAVSTTPPTSATLERSYSEPSGSPTAYILDAYVTLPLNFHRFLSVLDPLNRWRLRWAISSQTVDRWDPARQSTGSPRLLANQALSPVVADLGKPRFELYPYQTSARVFPVWYYRKPESLADDDSIVGPLAQNAPEVLLDGALSRCALWPGTGVKKNPYFSPSLAQTHRGLFEDRLIEIAVTDENMYFEELPLTEFGWADFPWDASWLQSHEPYVIG